MLSTRAREIHYHSAYGYHCFAHHHLFRPSRFGGGTPVACGNSDAGSPPLAGATRRDRPAIASRTARVSPPERLPSGSNFRAGLGRMSTNASFFPRAGNLFPPRREWCGNPAFPVCARSAIRPIYSVLDLPNYRDLSIRPRSPGTTRSAGSPETHVPLVPRAERETRGNYPCAEAAA